MDYLTINHEVDLNSYVAEIMSLFNDKDTLFYIDTCFLTHLYKYNKDLRQDFYTWIENSKGQVFLPHWAYCEYIKHTYDENSLQDLSYIKQLKSSKKQLETNLGYLKYLVDDKKLESLKLSSNEDFSKKINESMGVISTIINAFDTKKQLIPIRTEINSFLKDIVMTDNYEIGNNLSAEFSIRCENKIPPGFDEAKKINIIGDFIIWKEILSHITIQKKEKAKVIFLTNDIKKDWCYKPTFIGQRKICDFDIRLADPRLVKEFYDKTKSDNFFVCDFSLFSLCLSQIDPDKYKNLKYHFAANTTDDSSLENLDTQDESSQITEKQDTSSKKTLENILQLKTEVIKDSLFYQSTNPDVNTIVKGFKSHDWYKQSPALNKFISLDINQIDNNDIFLIARNIYQAACGGEWDSIYLLQNPEAFVTTFKTKDNIIVLGMLFEVYFNKYGELRKELKSKFLQELFTLRMKYKDSFALIGKCIKASNGKFIYSPGDENNTFNIVIQVEEQVCDSQEKNIITSIKIDGKELISDIYEQIPLYCFEFNRTFYSESALKAFFENYLYIPKDLIKIDSDLSRLKYPLYIDIEKYIKIS